MLSKDDFEGTVREVNSLMNSMSQSEFFLENSSLPESMKLTIARSLGQADAKFEVLKSVLKERYGNDTAQAILDTASLITDSYVELTDHDLILIDEAYHKIQQPLIMEALNQRAEH